jgi:predicted RNA polymerase sigma factor
MNQLKSLFLDAFSAAISPQTHVVIITDPDSWLIFSSRRMQFELNFRDEEKRTVGFGLKTSRSQSGERRLIWIF